MVLRFRQFGDTDYLFALNDRRQFGDYVGHHGKVMEQGLLNSATISVRRKAGFIYDLVSHRAVPAQPTADGLQFAADFGPGDGRLFMLTPRAIAGVELSAPARAQLGSSVEVTVTVLDSDGKPTAALVPVQIEVLDPQGKPAEFSGYYGAKGGKLSVTLNLATNDEAGTWRIRARELASGRGRQTRLVVAP